MAITLTSSNRTQAGRFVKGVSGNPTGRPRGARNRVTLAVEALLNGQPAELTQIAIAKALKGNLAALRICMDRIAPPVRNAPIDFDLPPITCAADAVKASAALLDAVGAGDVRPDEAGQIMALITAHKSLTERGEHETRISALGAVR